MAKQLPDGTWNTFIALGDKSENPDYTTSVEITVRDGHGKVISKQTDGFVTVSNPRTRPDELLKAGKIDEATAEKMKSQIGNIPDSIKNELHVKRNM